MTARARWLGRIGSCVLRAYGKTWRVRVFDGPTEPLSSWIFAFSHGQMLMPASVFRDSRIVAMTSHHGDGEVVAQVIHRLGMETVRGSSSRGGARALHELLRDWPDRGWVLTPDGPRGPLHSVQPGVIRLASLSGRPVVPVGFAASWAKRLSSWDRFTIPAPFARVAAQFAEPLKIPPELGREQVSEWTERLSERMRETREEAERRLRDWS